MNYVKLNRFIKLDSKFNADLEYEKVIQFERQFRYFLVYNIDRNNLDNDIHNLPIDILVISDPDFKHMTLNYLILKEISYEYIKTISTPHNP